MKKIFRQKSIECALISVTYTVNLRLVSFNISPFVTKLLLLQRDIIKSNNIKRKREKAEMNVNSKRGI